MRLAGAILLLWSAQAGAQVSLGDAVGAALRQSPELADARLQVQIAAADTRDADAPFDLHVDANWSYAESFAPVFVSGLAAQRVVRLRDFIFDQSVTRKFGTGTELSVQYLSLTENVLGLPEGDIALTRETVQLRLNQPLLRGRSPSANLGPLHAAEKRDEASHLTARAKASDLVRAVESAYWELSYAEREVDVEERLLDAARRHLEDTRRRVRAGRVAPADMLVVERAIAVAADELVAADGRRRLRALDLARLTGLDPTSLRTRDVPRARGTIRPDAALDAVRASPVMRALDLLRAAREDEVRAIDDRSLPRLDVFATLGPSGEKPTFGEAFGAMARFDELAWSVGLQFTWAPHGSAEQAAAERSAVELRRAGLARESARRDLEDHVRRIVAALDGANRRVELARAAVDLARRAVAAEQARFDAGAVPAKNVLDRQIEQAQTELRAARVETDAAIARAELEGLTGENLDRYAAR